MKNPVVRVKMHIRREDGSYRYVDPVQAKNGKLKPFCCVIKAEGQDKEEKHPEGVYNLRYLNANGKRVWLPVGQDAELVMMAKRKKESELLARQTGLLSPDEPVAVTTRERKPAGQRAGETLAEAVAFYMHEQTRLNRPPGTIKEYARTLRYFEESYGATKPLAPVKKSDLIDYTVLLRGRVSANAAWTTC